MNKRGLLKCAENFQGHVRDNSYFRAGLGLLDLVSCERYSPTIISYLCGCGWDMSSWFCCVIEEYFLYKYVFEWVVK